VEMAAPIPREPPVTNATLPVRSGPFMFSFLCRSGRDAARMRPVCQEVHEQPIHDGDKGNRCHQTIARIGHFWKSSLL
jgi:hypothetical protein